MLTGCVSSLFYYPGRIWVQTPESFGKTYEDVFFASEDGTLLHGWFLPADPGPATGTVIHFHGNAHNLSSHLSYVDWLAEEGLNVFTFDYRGYGLSEGHPDRSGVLADSRQAIRYVAQRDDVDSDRLILLGQSLGGANAVVAAATLSEWTPKAVIVDSAFYSYRSIVSDKIAMIPVLRWIRVPLSWMVIGNRYSPGHYIANLHEVPLLIFHGENDPVVPFRHGQRLYEKAKEPKVFCPVEGPGHIEALNHQRNTMGPILLEFIDQAL